jgi:hypothetical protein
VKPEDLTEEIILKAMKRNTSHFQRYDDFAYNCHAVSWALIRTGLLGEGGPNLRIARGACHGVGGQHSWVVIGHPYNQRATIVDLTLWSYSPNQPRIWIGSMLTGFHRPKGCDIVFDGPKPESGDGDPLPLDITGLSGEAQWFVAYLGPLDARGWGSLWSNCGMLGWPAKEILEAFLDQYPDLTALVPIDIVGMVTDRNPQETYW